MNPLHVAVEGPMGVGKTTLARRLARHMGAREILEDVENPFLAGFYERLPGAAFQCQVYFLLTRYKQQLELVQGDLFDQKTVSDYMFQKDKIFAYLNLDRADLNIYEKLHETLVEQVAKPDLVIYLQASDAVLMERIAKRGRGVEHAISARYVGEVNQAYNYFFFHYSETPLLAVNTDHVDLATSDRDFAAVLRQVEELEAGTRYYVPD